ncbi:FGFR1 oncogene partner 2 homolog isoform X1 [Plutella xylostella]|nr:FGFR1 oncogene partner 2 homolog isoform X1 [Plutella xylostella]
MAANSLDFMETADMSLTIQQIILDAKRLAGRLKERETEADALLTETQTAYRQIHTMKQYKEEVDTLNEATRERPRGALIASIERESRLMRDVQRENGELRAALEDHRRALELIMSKYRQHTEKRIWESKIDFTSAMNDKQSELIRQQAERINEMTSVMCKAVTMDENGDTRKEEETYHRLITENKGLREMLDLSRTYGSDKPAPPPMEDKDVQTDGPPVTTA